MKTIYVADDGTQFYDKYECKDYEWVKNYAPPLDTDVEFYDKNNTLLLNKFSQNTYELTDKVIVKTKEGANALFQYTEYTGYYSFYDITGPGTWVWDKDNIGKGMFVLQK